MSLSSKTELARALFRSTPPDSVTRISGTATADSADGTVTVQLEDGDVIEVGTIGSVSAGDTVTIHVQRGEAQVIASEGWGDAMQQAVDDAAAIAEATGQHFWHDTNGAHVTEVTADQWAQSQTGHNILVNSLGILLRKALNYIAAWTGSALSFYDGNGNAASNVTASFGSAGAQIGKVDESHIEMDYHSMRLIDKDGIPYMHFSDLRNEQGEIEETWTGDGSTTEFYLTYRAETYVYTVTVDGVPAAATKNSIYFTMQTAPAVGAEIKATYVPFDILVAFTLGGDRYSPIGAYSVAEGFGHTASGMYSHAEGYKNTASGYSSHAEGDDSTASGRFSHAEGIATTAGGEYSHAEGGSTEAIGDGSHAQNVGTIAQGNGQTAIGKYNVADTTSALIVGNGTASSARSNAFTVGFDGEVKSNGTPLVPIGTILDFAAATAPTGYLVCDGSAVSRTTYAALFAVIGTTWGSGNGSTTFNVPDFRGRTAIGSGTGTGGNATAHALGSKGGDEALQAHSHNASANGDYKFQAIKNESGVAGSFNLQAHSSGANRYALASSNSGNLTYYTTTQSAGAGGSGNMQPFATVTKIIRAI